MLNSRCHYERLGVASTADSETLRQAFRRRSKDLHPDTTALPADQAASEFQMLRQSYELLQDPERRRRYDEQRGAQQLPGPPPPPVRWEAGVESVNADPYRVGNGSPCCCCC